MLHQHYELSFGVLFCRKSILGIRIIWKTKNETAKYESLIGQSEYTTQSKGSFCYWYSQMIIVISHYFN